MDSGLRPQDEKGTIEESLSFLDGLKSEWSLFWHSILGDEATGAVEDATGEKENLNPIEKLSVEQIKRVNRTLSQDRRKLNQRIEQINQEIDSHSEVLKSLELVGGDPSETLKKISGLNDVGQQLSSQLEKIDSQLRRFRDRSSL